MQAPSRSPQATRIPPDLLALMVKGVSVIVGTCALDLRSGVMRAMGSSVTADGGAVTVYLSRSQSGQLLRDIASTGRLSVLFTQPKSHRSVQVKGEGARIRDADASDQPALELYMASMEQELALIGYGSAFARAAYSYRLDDLAAVTFTPSLAFDQTPGPRAGDPLGDAAGVGA